jgi:hypothetical protein
MIGVRQHHLRAGIFEVSGGQRFDGGSRADRHKSRCFDDTMRRMKHTRTGMSMTTFTQAVKSEIGVIQGFMRNRAQLKIAGFIGLPKC